MWFSFVGAYLRSFSGHSLIFICLFIETINNKCMFISASSGWSQDCGLLLTSGICRTQLPPISYQVQFQTSPNVFLKFSRENDVYIWSFQFDVAWHEFESLQILMLQVMTIHCKTNCILSHGSSLFEISKLSKIVTLCHQENTSKQKYKKKIKG